MDSKELRNLHEAYMDVYAPQEVDEAVKGASRHDTEMRKSASKERKSGIKNRLSPAAGKDNANKMQRDIKFFDKLTKKNRNVVGLVTKEEYDTFDTILEYLIAEGYADTNESALVIMANMSEEWREDIMEISQKTATKAYATSSTGEFEGVDSPRDVERTNRLGRHIKRKFGKKAAEHADRAAHSMTFGRKGAGGMPPKP